MRTVSPERWKQIEDLLDEALDLPESDRMAHVARRAGEDHTLRGAVEGLLIACGQPTRLPDPPAALAGSLLENLASGEREAERLTRVGPYRIVRELGQGGMGAVFLAERDDDQFRKQVAVKVLRRGLASEPMIRRFRHERQILATLDHPGIARLLDGGIAPDGTPYIVMEFVDGKPLDRHCAESASSIPERLRLMRDVAAAVQYAHEQLVVHRDLKPSNILVTPTGQIKLLDFGIAKLLDEDESRDLVPLTRTGMRVMTPEYASPEQVKGGRVTPATDVYALGVILFELLAGQRPYQLAGRGLGDIERIICETEPPRPSTAVINTMGAGVSPDTARRRLRGDLDTIILKALRKDPARRYHSAAELLDDLRRYEEGRPVLARPDTVGYRARKFVGRHRYAVAGSVLLGALILGSAVRERSLRARAESEASTAAAAKEFLVGVFGASDPYDPSPERGREVTALELLDRGSRVVDSTLTDDPPLQAEMLTVLGRVYSNLGMYDRSAPLLERSVALWSGMPGHHAAVAESKTALGEAYLGQGKYTEAEPVLRAAVESYRVVRRSHPVHEAALATSLDRLATTLQEQGNYDGARSLFEEGLAVRRALTPSAPTAISESLNNLGVLSWLSGNYAAAESLYAQAIAIDREALGPTHPKLAETIHNLAQAKQLLGQLDSAEVLFRESLALKRSVFEEAHPSITVHLNNLGQLLRERQKFAEAESLFRQAMALDRKLFGEEHPYVAASMVNLANALLDRGRFAESRAAYQQTLVIYRKLMGPEHTRVAFTLNGLAGTYFREGNPAAAEPYYRDAVAMYGRTLGPDHPFTSAVTTGLAATLRERGTAEEAEALYRRVIGQFEAGLPQTEIRLGPALVGLGRTLLAMNRLEAADSALGRGLELNRKQFGEADPRTAEANLGYGMALDRAGRRTDAARHLSDARRVLDSVRVRFPVLARDADRAWARNQAGQ